jgi:aminoglycoside phosphotransferase (APT) family kinase protein
MTRLEPREYSKRVGVLTHQQLQAALERFDLGELFGAEPAPSGLFGQNVMLRSSTGEYVLRGAPWPAWQLPQERYVAGVIHTRTTVLAPWPYLIDESTDIFGWPFAITPRLAGETVANHDDLIRLTAGERLAMARAMGEGLAALHAAPFEAIAKYDPAGGQFHPVGEPYDEWFCAYARDWLRRCREASDATTDADALWVEAAIAGAKSALAVPFVPALVHHDYKENNLVFLRDTDGRWRVNGIFDLMECYVAEGEYDLARSFTGHVVPRAEVAFAFLDAYAAARGLRPGFVERFRLYLLVDRLIIWEYGQRNGIWFQPGQSFREYAEPGVAIDLSGYG